MVATMVWIRIAAVGLLALTGLACADDASEALDGGGGKDLSIDAGMEDAGAPDAGADDAGTPDGGPRDTGIPSYEALQLQNAFAEGETLEVRTQGIWAIWWDPRFEHDADAELLFERLEDLRVDCISRLGMRDPPNPEAGFYYNVYIHHGEQDVLPNEWANGQGTDRFRMPYLAMPPGAARQLGNVHHEGFHVFQYQANSPGFDYRGDSQWYVETAAQYYSASRNPDSLGAFIEAGAIAANPQLALWHSFSNEAPGDPKDWFYQVRQYGMHTLLFYLDTVKNVPANIFTEGFYANTRQSPQAYIFDRVPELRSYFADWAAANTAGFGYLSPEQVEYAFDEADRAGDPSNRHPIAAEVEAIVGEQLRVEPTEYLPRGWSYNVVRIHPGEASRVEVQLRGEFQGSEGASPHFLLRAVHGHQDGPGAIVSGAMDTPASSTLQVEAPRGPIDVIVASMPEHFTGNQTYGYALLVRADAP